MERRERGREGEREGGRERAQVDEGRVSSRLNIMLQMSIVL